MSAYVIVDLEPKHPEKYEEYRKLAPAIVKAYGGKYLVRGTKIEPLEGNWTPRYVAVLEFESMEHAKAWYDSPEYVAIRGMRQENTNSKIILVDGVPQEAAR